MKRKSKPKRVSFPKESLERGLEVATGMPGTLGYMLTGKGLRTRNKQKKPRHKKDKKTFVLGAMVHHPRPSNKLNPTFSNKTSKMRDDNHKIMWLY